LKHPAGPFNYPISPIKHAGGTPMEPVTPRSGHGSGPMLLTLDSNAFWVTKSTKDTRSARRKIIVRDLVWERFSCAFSSSCPTNTFQVRKATKVFIQIGFLCGSSCLLRALRDPRRAFLTAPNCSLTKGQENSKFACCYAALGLSAAQVNGVGSDPSQVFCCTQKTFKINISSLLRRAFWRSKLEGR